MGSSVAEELDKREEFVEVATERSSWLDRSLNPMILITVKKLSWRVPCKMIFEEDPLSKCPPDE